MASSGNNITAVHFSLIFFVMLSIILGVVAYLNVDKLNELSAKVKKADADASAAKSERDKFAEGLRNLKAAGGAGGDIGKNGQNVGRSDAPAAQMRAILKAAGDENSNLVDLLKKKIQQIDSERKSLAAQRAALTKATTDYQQKVDALNKNYADAERKMKEAETQKLAAQGDQRTAEKNLADAKLAHVQALNTLKAEKTRMEEAYKKQVEGLKKDILDLNATIARKQDIIDKLVNTTFERPDGLIRSVDYRTKLVWVNLGSEDKLPERMTFSVYSQKHQGVARDSERYEKLRTQLDRDMKNRITNTKQRNNRLDKLISRAKSLGHDTGTRGVKGGDIKGAIEITRIVGPHLSEARILTSDLYDPIRPGDPIYTPLWSPGVEERFAFSVYLDGKEFSGLDWPLLKRIVKSADAKIDAEMDPTTGKIIYTDGGISDKTKFLVITDLPPADQVADQKAKAVRLAMSASQKKLRDDARKFGVRVVKLSDFLQYLGYKPDRRLWRPGDDSPRKLKAGARSTTVDQSVSRRQSSGRTSGVFTRRGRIKKKNRASSGRTSGAYGRQN